MTEKIYRVRCVDGKLKRMTSLTVECNGDV